MNRLSATAIIFSIILLSSNIGYASPRIAVLNFELSDLTSLPNTVQEQQRTSSIRPLLEQALNQMGGYEIINIDAEAQAHANSSFGYLFRFNDLAAKLGAEFGADWVIVGRHSKPSFLFSYLMVHLINVKTRTLTASFDIELKGNHQSVTQRGVNKLVEKIQGTIK